jgi:hypothetical protein
MNKADVSHHFKKVVMAIVVAAAGVAATILVAGTTVFIAGTTFVVSSQEAEAYPRNGPPCGRCHVNPGGGGPLKTKKKKR